MAFLTRMLMTAVPYQGAYCCGMSPHRPLKTQEQRILSQACWTGQTNSACVPTSTWRSLPPSDLAAFFAIRTDSNFLSRLLPNMKHNYSLSAANRRSCLCLLLQSKLTLFLNLVSVCRYTLEDAALTNLYIYFSVSILKTKIGLFNCCFWLFLFLFLYCVCFSISNMVSNGYPHKNSMLSF